MRGHLLALSSVISVALAARMVQLLLSSLPLNIDSFAQVAIASEILSSGRWVLDETDANYYNLKMPGLPVFLALASAVTAARPILAATPLMILISLVGILGLYALVHGLTRSRESATASSLVLALLGPYIFLSSTLIKEALALALLPVIIWLFLRRRDPRCRVLSMVILLLLPLVHHLSTFMAYGFVSLLLLLESVQALWRGRLRWRDLGVDILSGPALFPFALWYYLQVRMEFFTQVWNPNDVALFLSTAILMGSAAIFLASDRRARPWFALSKARILPSLLDQKAVVIVGAFLLVLANLYRPVFPGTVTTSTLLLVAASAYVPITLLALAGLNLFRMSSSPSKGHAIGLLLAPMTVIVFSLLRGLDPLSHVLLYRSADFLDFGMALCVGASLVAVTGPKLRRAAALMLVASLLLTIPMAYATEEVFQVQNTTYAYEVAALRHVSLTADSLNTDQRLAAVASMYYGLEAESSLPISLLAGGPIQAGSILLVETVWTTRGAQMHPRPFVRVDPDAMSALLQNGHLVYAGGDAFNAVYVIVGRG